MTSFCINLQGNLSDAEYQAQCLELTGTKCLHWLRHWCHEHLISQSSWAGLYFALKTYIESNGQYKVDPEVWCCVNEEILEIESQSYQACNRIGWVLLPVDQSWEVYDGNILKGVIDSCPHDGFVTKCLELPGVGDKYTAALSFLRQEEVAKATLDEQRATLEMSYAAELEVDTKEYF